MSEETARLDVWLWRARFLKTRTLAAEMVERRGVRIGRAGLVRKVNKPGTPLRVGDVITLGRGQDVQTVRIMALGERRGSAEEARTLYEDVMSKDAPGD